MQLWAGTNGAVHPRHCNLWYGGGNCHQSMWSVLLQCVVLAGDKPSPGHITSSAAGQPLLHLTSTSTPHPCWNTGKRIHALFPHRVSPGCVQGPVLGILLAPDHFSSHRAGTSDEERGWFEANHLNLISRQNLLTVWSCGWNGQQTLS